MLMMVSRIYQEGQLVGYELSDGSKIKPFTKQEVWNMAKGKIISDVVASGNLLNPVLSGVNGFEIKQLPVKSFDDANKNVMDMVDHDMIIAFIIRHDIENGMVRLENGASRRDIVQYYKDELREDILSGKIDVYNLGSKRNSIELKGIIINSRDKGQSRLMTRPLTIEEKKLIHECKEMAKKVEELELLKNSDKFEEIKSKLVSIKSHIEYLDTSCIKCVMALTEDTINNLHDKIKLAILKIDENLNVLESNNINFKSETLPKNIDDVALYIKKFNLHCLDILEEAIKLCGETIGYRVRNIGNESISITRIALDVVHTTSEVKIAPGEEINLNKLETAILFSSEGLSNKCANAKLICRVLSSDKDIFSILKFSWLDYRDSQTVGAIEILTSDTQDNIDKYFTNKSSKFESEIHKTRRSIGQNKNLTGLMQMFNR